MPIRVAAPPLRSREDFGIRAVVLNPIGGGVCKYGSLKGTGTVHAYLGSVGRRGPLPMRFGGHQEPHA